MPFALPIPPNADIIQNCDGARYGREIAMVCKDTLDEMVDAYISSFPTSLPDRPAILDLGGASGYRADQLTAHGGQACIVDLCDQSLSVAWRNAARQTQTPITFIKGNIVELPALKLPAIKWDIINLRRVIHWLPLSDVKTVIENLPAMMAPDARLAICFQHTSLDASESLRSFKTATNFFYQHNPRMVLDIMHDAGLEIASEACKLETISRSTKLFAKRRLILA